MLRGSYHRADEVIVVTSRRRRSRSQTIHNHENRKDHNHQDTKITKAVFVSTSNIRLPSRPSCSSWFIPSCRRGDHRYFSSQTITKSDDFTTTKTEKIKNHQDTKITKVVLSVRRIFVFLRVLRVLRGSYHRADVVIVVTSLRRGSRSQTIHNHENRKDQNHQDTKITKAVFVSTSNIGLLRVLSVLRGYTVVSRGDRNHCFFAVVLSPLYMASTNMSDVHAGLAPNRASQSSVGLAALICARVMPFFIKS